MSESVNAPAEAPANAGSPIAIGVIGIALLLAAAVACIAPFENQFFLDWVATAFMAATPTQVILGLLWENNQPGFVAKLPQPLKGIALTLITVASGAVVLFLVMTFVSGGHGITPMLVQYVIMTVVATLWMVPIWHCWPVSLFSQNPLVIGVVTLVLSYLLAYVLWMVFFNYEFLGTIGFPLYFADIDPKGLFGFWEAMTFFVTTVAVIIVHSLFDFAPMDKVSFGMPQPVRGLMSTIYVLALSYAVRALFVDVIGMEQVEYMVRGPVCVIFGTFLVTNMMQFSLFSQLAGAVRGFALLAAAIVAGMIMWEVYGFASQQISGQDLPMGPATGYAKELWVASAMLGVTFPLVFIISGFFDFWPLKRAK